jgi:hypothetical protein
MNIEVLPPFAPLPRRPQTVGERAAREAQPVSFQREPAPLVPGGNVFRRLLTARGVGLVTRQPPADVAAAYWPSDRLVKEMLTRAVSGPAQYAQPGWAAELIHTTIQDALAAMAPASAGAQLLKQSTVLNGDAGIIVAPGFVASAANAGFVADGQPIPVRQLADSAVSLNPYKLCAIAVLTEEMIRSSNAEQLIGDTLIRSAAAALDVVLFGTAAATAAQPAGLRYGIAPLTPSNDPSAWEAYFEDAAQLINSVSAVGGSGPFILVANAGRGVEMRLRALGDEGNPYIILPSAAIGNDMMAVAPGAVVCAMDPEPELEASNASQLVMADNAGPIVNGGAPGSPQKSMWQTASIALKMRWRVTWGLRDPRGVAWLTPAWK